jgi:hypothetical protein
MTVRITRFDKAPPDLIAQMLKKREPHIRAALKLLAPERRFRDECGSDIDEAITVIEVNTAVDKKETRALKSLQSALVRASALARAAGLRGDLVKNQIALCNRLLAQPPWRPPSRQAEAVKEAIHLISKWNRKAPTGVTRGSKWHKLSAILYGDAKIDLFNHMRAYRRAARPSSKQISR